MEKNKKLKNHEHAHGEEGGGGGFPKMKTKPGKTEESIRMQIWLQDIRGICYYFDHAGNVYNTMDVFENKMDPAIIGRWVTMTDIFQDPKGYPISEISISDDKYAVMLF